MQVAFLESVDMMFGHVLKLLWESNQESGHDFTLVCTGDHTTPVVFGDHSYEPVPLSMGNLNDVVRGRQPSLKYTLIDFDSYGTQFFSFLPGYSIWWR